MTRPRKCVINNPSAPGSLPYPFTIYSWNAFSLLARAPSIQLFLTQHQPSILIIIEPMIHDATHIPTVPYYQPVHVPHPTKHSHGGLVIYFHASITYQQQHIMGAEQFTHNTATSTSVFHVTSPVLPRPFLLVPLYISCQATSNDWHDMLHFFSTLPSLFSPGHDMPTLIIGDMNARDPMWDNNFTPHHSNSSGTRLNSFLS